ncbi:hypothetical protein H6F90_29230 [Trichocoleus sp. FACHB-591]|uniref:hypothetical protein n=1 Tax=Trichocoleus sp. FACHB-591 TaxID=2692872 RepID=UPI001686204F|nr:hypothetical protein [Trichocoleus sp. FACHB-591]MBD2099150.1 hypothetical protein [Trichocoleus sp. FACHB-591]
MVERPIKKSERQVADNPSSDAAGFQGSEASDSDTRNSEERVRSRPSRDKSDRNDKGSDRGSGRGGDRDKRKGRGRDQEDDRARTPVNPALMRGPKPTQPKPPVVQPEPEVEENATAEADSEVATES